MSPDEKEQILREALLLSNCSGWYQSEIKKVISRIQEIEDSVDIDNKAALEHRELQGRLSYLLGKGLFENRQIKRFKSKIKDLK